MALFKISKGLKANLPSTKTVGYCWYTTDDSLFYIDYEDESGVLQRKALNAKDAETLSGASLATILNSTDLEIPTSKTVFDALLEKADVSAGQYVVTASSSDGITYTADVPSITELTTGVSFIMIPGRVSASTAPTLNVNGLGAKYIRRRLSNIATGVQPGYTNTWLAVNLPFRVTYDGTQWIVEGQNKPVSADLYGVVPINKGGTGADNAEEALANLGIYIGDTEPTDENIRIWINTAEEGTGVTPVLPRVATITLAADSWSGSSSPYSQVVEINTVTSATKVELNATVSQIVSLQNDDIALMAENDGGVVTIYSFGGTPSADMTMQVTLTEVSYV